jgi:uncharacterized membrane protein YidH (DUF202 family)
LNGFVGFFEDGAFIRFATPFILLAIAVLIDRKFPEREGAIPVIAASLHVLTALLVAIPFTFLLIIAPMMVFATMAQPHIPTILALTAILLAPFAMIAFALSLNRMVFFILGVYGIAFIPSFFVLLQFDRHPISFAIPAIAMASLASLLFRWPRMTRAFARKTGRFNHFVWLRNKRIRMAWKTSEALPSARVSYPGLKVVE